MSVFELKHKMTSKDVSNRLCVGAGQYGYMRLYTYLSFSPSLFSFFMCLCVFVTCAVWELPTEWVYVVHWSIFDCQ